MIYHSRRRSYICRARLSCQLDDVITILKHTHFRLANADYWVTDLIRFNMVSYRRVRGRLVKALPSPIVGLVRLCLGSTMTSSDLPPDLHSNHIEILYFIDLLRIGPVPAYTLFVYLALAAVAKYFNIVTLPRVLIFYSNC